MYTLNYDFNTGKVSSIQKDNMSIPIAEGNSDFRKFLIWNAEQATPLDLNSTQAIPTTYILEPDRQFILVDVPVHFKATIKGASPMPTSEDVDINGVLTPVDFVDGVADIQVAAPRRGNLIVKWRELYAVAVVV